MTTIRCTHGSRSAISFIRLEASNGAEALAEAPHDRTRFVLHVDASAAFANRLRTEDAVRAHASQHDGQRVGAERGGNAAKEDIDSRPAGIFRGRLVHREMDARGA